MFCEVQMTIWCDICTNCSVGRFPGLARSAFFDATTPCRCPLSSVGKSLFRAFSQKRGTLSRNTRSFRVFVAGFRARTYAHSAGFRFLPSPFVCYRLIFSVLWVKMVFFFVGSRLHGRKGALRRGAKWSVSASSSPSHSAARGCYMR